MRTRLLCLVVALTAVGCRDLNITDLPPGTVYGTLVYTRPGSADRYPASGALVELLGTSLSTTANADGFFLLSNITRSTGQIRISFDPDGIGKATRQRLIDLKDINAGLNRQIALGEVLVSQNARLHGKVVRGDLPSVGGHSGTQVFVPEGPYTTFTNDDGSYQLRDLPEGTLRIAFFRPGYGTQLIDGLTLRPSEDFAVSDVVLDRDLTVQVPATISGHVSFSPALANALGTTVVAVDTLGASVAGSVQADGAISVANVPPGVYRVTVSHDGYVPASIGNVLVGSGASVVLQEIVLMAGQAPDAGTDAGTPIDAGTSCSPGASCTIGTVCHAGAIDCSTGSPQCVDIGFKIDGTPCGANKVCSTGLCQSLCGVGLSCLAVAQGEGQSRFVNQQLTQVVLVATDDAGIPIIGAQISISAPLGASCTPSSGATNDQGQFMTTVRVGRSVGPYTFTATSPDVSGAALIHATANPATDQMIYPLANAGQLYGNYTPNSAAADAYLAYPAGVAVASDGTVYVADTYSQCIRKISPEGVIATVAATCGGPAVSTGDNGPASVATFYYPGALALDEAAGLLYVADDSNLVRMIDLNMGWIFAFAGGGPIQSAPYGDNGLAVDAYLSPVTALSLGRETPRKHVYIGLQSPQSRIRRVDENGIITTYMVGSGGTQPVELSTCSANEGACGVVFDAAGNAFVSGEFTGTSMSGPSRGIARRAPSGALTHVAGEGEGSLGGNGVSAQSAMFSDAPAIAMDPAGNLFAAVRSANVVWKIERGTGRMALVSGTGTGSYGGNGDWGDAKDAGLYSPRQIAFFPSSPRDLVIADAYNSEIRAIRNAGDSTVPASTLGALAPPASVSLSATINRTIGATTHVTLTAGGSPLMGYPISISSVTDGGSAGPAVTGVGGQAPFFLRAGLALRNYVFQARFTDIYGVDVAGSPVTFTVTGVAPDAGTIVPVVSESGGSGNAGLGGPAVFARAYDPKGLAIASNGTIYFTDQTNNQIKVVSPEGIISLLAGTGTYGFGGDSGDAMDAKFAAPQGVALDEASNKLYIADTGNNRIRMIDLAQANKPITTVAGGAPGSPPNDGDGDFGTNAVLISPSHIRFRSPYLYISSWTRMRRLHVSSLMIEPYLLAPNNCTAPAEFATCFNGCDIAWDQVGTPYLAGQFCGTGYLSTAYGVARVDPDGGVTQVAGVAGGSTGEATFATSTGFTFTAPTIAFGPDNLLYMAVPEGHAIRRIDPDARVRTIAGIYGTGALNGNWGPADAGTLNFPWDLALAPGGHWIVSDTSNHTVRMVW